ncbi:MAG TPA: GtrA family protein [Candidatus Baltobacteraceae bacterium]
MPSVPSVVTSISHRRGVRQFVKFGLVGLSGFVINFIIFSILQKTTPMPLLVDNSIGFMAGGVSNYFLNRAWTFRSSGDAKREGAQFLIVSLLALIVDNLVFAVLLHATHHTHYHTVWFVATLSSVFVNFFLNKYWTFKHLN